MPGLWAKTRTTLDMIKWEHSIFALPFALTAVLLAANGLPAGRTVVWILVAMVAARSSAMAFNRWADADLDAANPRTKTRAIPAGLLSRRFVLGFTILAALIFVLATAQLNRLTLYLSPLVLMVLLGYSYMKRVTRWSHLVLGLALGLAPSAAWIAVRGSLNPRILWLTAAVTFWTSGFDVIYSCQDYQFDCEEGLASVPRMLGIAGALRVSQALHILMVACLLALVYTLHLGALALAGVAAVVALLLYEHSLVKPYDLSRVNAAFFTMNGYVSVLFFLFWAADIFLLKPGA
jgi:4-hydroxybenzoate polyprenyltransferase